MGNGYTLAQATRDLGAKWIGEFGEGEQQAFPVMG